MTKKKPSQSKRRPSKPAAASAKKSKRPNQAGKGTKANKAPKKAGGKPAASKAKSKVIRPAEALPISDVRPISERDRRDSLANAKAAIDAALDKKAVEPVLIDVCGRASYADFIAVVSGRSDRQVDAIADSVCQAMAERGRRPIGREGARNGRWALIDFGDVVVHVFYHPLREVFDIESLWIDAPRVKLNIPAEARIDAGGGSGS